MKHSRPRGWLVACLGLLAACTTSCTWFTRWVVTNTTSGTITVRYALPRRPPGATCLLAGQLPEVGRVQGRYFVSSRTPLSESEYVFDLGECSYTLTLASGMSVVVASTHRDRTYGLLGEVTHHEISVNGAEGALAVSGRQVPRHFIRRSRTLCELEYGGPP